MNTRYKICTDTHNDHLFLNQTNLNQYFTEGV